MPERLRQAIGLRLVALTDRGDERPYLAIQVLGPEAIEQDHDREEKRQDAVPASNPRQENPE
jgi:hypothetical protein